MLQSEALSGVLLATALDDFTTIPRALLTSSTNFRPKSRIASSHWEEFDYQSSEALAREDLVRPPPFVHPIACRVSGPRILLVAPHKRIVEHAVDKVLSKLFKPRLRSVPILVDGIVRALTDDPSHGYLLTYVHARVAPYGTDLRSQSFYGDDLANAKLFRDALPLISCTTCGIRPADSEHEILRLGNDGAVSFFFANPERLQKVEDALGFVASLGFLDAGPRGGPSGATWA